MRQQLRPYAIGLAASMIAALLIVFGMNYVRGIGPSAEGEYHGVTILNDSPDAVEFRVYDLATQEPTPTTEPDPTATNTPEPTPTTEPTPTNTPEPTPTESEILNVWHESGSHDGLGNHEHGDAPPLWAQEFSLENFGHEIVYGGDEGTPNENVLKHEAFKGQVVPSAAGGEAYVRFHAQSNPHGRAAQFHSYELYYRDTSGNVSFLQGWQDCGNPDTVRFPRSQGDPGDRPAMLVVDQAAWDVGIRTEQWYCHGPQGGEKLVEIGVNINQTTTIWHEGEHLLTPTDQSTWDVTGSHGTTRLVDFFLIEQRYDNRMGWFCLDQYGAEVDCSNAEALQQYIAPTFYNDMREQFNVRRISGQVQRSFECTSCELPN